MITAIMIGAGQRGHEVYGAYRNGHTDRLTFVAVAEPNKARRERFAKEQNIPRENCFSTWEDLLEKDVMADCAFVCTQDRMHTKTAKLAMEKGYNVVLEKPMAPTAQECIELGEYSEKYNKSLNVCHVLRYSEFFTTIQGFIVEGLLGEIVNIRHAENVSFWHQAHSFVRGNWRNSQETTPMVLQKTCHDMDILSWLIGKPCKKVSSFGGIHEFTIDKKPLLAPNRCTDGCPHSKECLYNAEDFYLGENTAWPVSVISEDTSVEARRKALENGPYGRCVYACDNDVVDHQVTNLEFEGGITASLTMTAFTNDCTRYIEIMGTKGCLRAEMNKFGEKSNANEIFLTDFKTGETTVHYAKDKGLMNGHEGADVLMTDNFVTQIENQELDGLTSAKHSIESHLMSIAAEKSRLEGIVVEIDSLRK